MREGNHNDICGICHQSFENHSADYNIDLLYLQNKYGEMLNQVTQMDTISRPFTPKTIYSIVLKKAVVANDKLPIVSNINSDPKYGTYLGPSHQSGSNNNSPSPKRKAHIGENADIEYITKVEKIKLEHYKMCSKALKYICSNNIVDLNEERQPSKFHVR
jgi:hypothetical protein